MTPAMQQHLSPAEPLRGRVHRLLYEFDGQRLKLIFLHAGYESKKLGNPAWEKGKKP